MEKLEILTKTLKVASTSSLAFYPIQKERIKRYYDLQLGLLWTPKEIPYNNDVLEWKVVSNSLKNYVKFILFLFAQLDKIININIEEYFAPETVKYYKECGSFYKAQALIEEVHNETYSLLLITLLKDPSLIQEGLDAIRHHPSIAAIAHWAASWMNHETSLLERLVAFVCIEGIIFNSAFAGIYYIKKLNILAALCKANEWIARDEKIHAFFGIELISCLVGDGYFEPLAQERVHEIIRSAVTIAEGYTRVALEEDLIGLRADDMVCYVQCTADHICEAMGYGKIYNAKNPFDWMVVIGLHNKTNFFEGEVSEYTKGSEEVDTQSTVSMYDFEQVAV